MVRQHSKRGHREAAVERADRERGQHGAAAAFLQQLLEPLELAFVVAEDERGWRARQQAAQPVQVAVDPLGREEAELEIDLLVPQEQPGERG